MTDSKEPSPDSSSATEARFRTLFEQSADAIYLHDEEGVILDVNDRACEQLGYAADEIVGKKVWDISADPEPAAVRRIWSEMASDDIVTIDGVHQRKDGTTFPVEVRVSVVELDGGRQFLATVRDITPQRERERELEQYETIVETVPVGVFVLDDEATIVEGNARAAEMFGFEYEELVGKPFQRLIEDGIYSADIIDAYVGHVRELLSDETDAERAVFEHTVTVNGEERIIEASVALRPFDDEYRGTVGVLRDITEQRRRANELNRQNERLEEFASVLSHDLRNPLNVAVGRLELAREECDSEHLDAISAAHARMDELIQDTLSLARAGEAIGQTEAVELSALVAAGWRNVETESATLINNAERTLQADESRLRQLLENLFRNSIEHAGPETTIEAGDLADGFYVQDDGPGIPEEKRDEVLKPGYSTQEDGTGFGLSIVREIAEAHGWKISITEGSAGGARFEFSGVDSR